MVSSGAARPSPSDATGRGLARGPRRQGRGEVTLTYLCQSYAAVELSIFNITPLTSVMVDPVCLCVDDRAMRANRTSTHGNQ